MQDIKDSNRIIIYSDGSCVRGHGGWGTVIFLNDEEIEMSAGETNTTNNRMELMAVIRGLEFFDTSSKISVYSDSKYVITGISEWVEGWKNRDWKTASNKPVKNKDLWERLDNVASEHNIIWNWVKGHGSDMNNIRVDTLAGIAGRRLTERVKFISLEP